MLFEQWALHFALPSGKSSNDTVVFVTCFLAIIPLAKLLAFGTEELAIRVGQTLGGLLNATRALLCLFCLMSEGL